MPTVSDSLFQGQLHKLLAGRRHILKALAERHYRETHALEILYHLHGIPAVKCNLTDIETLTELFDKFSI